MVLRLCKTQASNNAFQADFKAILAAQAIEQNKVANLPFAIVGRAAM